jgi:hypothetical protein
MTDPVELDYGETIIRDWNVGDDAAGHPYVVRHAQDDGEDVWRFSHVCTSPRSGRTFRVGPRLQIGHGHEVLSTDPLHIEASILCTDCDTHGWVRDGRWVTA